MARALYVRQKKLLDKILTDNSEINHVEDLVVHKDNYWDKLLAIYEWESIHSHVESYIWDFRMNQVHGSK